MNTTGQDGVVPEPVSAPKGKGAARIKARAPAGALLRVAKAGSLKKKATWQILCGDAGKMLKTLPARKFNCVVTSPPYFWQRDYGVDGQIGLEQSIEGYVTAIADVMDGVRRVLTPEGVLFLNLGDTYYSKKGRPQGRDRKNWARRGFGEVRLVDTSGLPYRRKTLLGMPWRVVLEMISRGWILRSNIIWCREHVQPEPTALDRPWRSYENIYMFSKSPVYHFDREGLDGHPEDVWVVHSQSRQTNKSLSAYFPEELVERCLKVACPPGGHVLDPFSGGGTVVKVAMSLNLSAVGLDLNPVSCEAARNDLREMFPAGEQTT